MVCSNPRSKQKIPIAWLNNQALSIQSKEMSSRFIPIFLSRYSPIPMKGDAIRNKKNNMIPVVINGMEDSVQIANMKMGIHKESVHRKQILKVKLRTEKEFEVEVEVKLDWFIHKISQIIGDRCGDIVSGEMVELG